MSARSLSLQRRPRAATVVPPGAFACATFLIGTFFLRSSSLPTGFSGQHMFLACCVSLVATVGYLVANWKLEVSPVCVAFLLLTLPSIRAAADTQDAALRWVGWCMIVAAIGPLFVNELKVKLLVLNGTRRVLLFCALGSLLINLAGIRLTGRGMFFGLMGHTMILAPVCALAALDLFCTLKQKRSRLGILLLIACCVTCVGTGSRGAVAGLGFGILTHVAHRRQGIMVIAATLSALVAVSYVHSTDDEGQSVGKDLSSGLYSEIASKGTNDTRGELWAARLHEFASSPVIGVGFQQQTVFRRDADENSLEPGSSYLAILSMTGIVGGIGFLLLMAPLGAGLLRRASTIPSEYRDLLRGWAAFFSLHLVVEGYIYASGSLLCFLFWLTIGCTAALEYQGRRLQLRQRTILRSRQSRKLERAA
ncbi:MAG: O-antigen ligase family protein [Fuerstiella sp.]